MVAVFIAKANSPKKSMVVTTILVCFTIWMAGGGVQPGMTYGETDEFSYNVIKDPVHVHDLHATIMHLLGVDHTRLTYRYQGRDFRLTDVHGQVVQGILS